MRQVWSFAALISAMMVTSALAGGPTAAPEEPAVAPAIAVTDWSGLYLGLSFAKPNGENYWDGSFEQTTSEAWEGSNTTVSVGHDWQRGNLVFGLGLSYGTGTYSAYLDTLIMACPDCETHVSKMAALRGRIGFATGRTLVYATAGFAQADVEMIDTGGLVGSDRVNGHTVGIGLEHMLGDRFSVSAEYLTTDLGRLYSDPAYCAPDVCFTDIKFDQMQIGLNLRF